jgi:hypothetical protein
VAAAAAVGWRLQRLSSKDSHMHRQRQQQSRRLLASGNAGPATNNPPQAAERRRQLRTKASLSFALNSRSACSLACSKNMSLRAGRRRERW